MIASDEGCGTNNKTLECESDASKKCLRGDCIERCNATTTTATSPTTTTRPTTTTSTTTTTSPTTTTSMTTPGMLCHITYMYKTAYAFLYMKARNVHCSLLIHFVLHCSISLLSLSPGPCTTDGDCVGRRLCCHGECVYTGYISPRKYFRLRFYRHSCHFHIWQSYVQSKPAEVTSERSECCFRSSDAWHAPRLEDTIRLVPFFPGVLKNMQMSTGNFQYILL